MAESNSVAQTGRQTPGKELRIGMEDTLKVLIVDDTAFMRKAVANILSTDPGIEVLDSAKNGLDALHKIKYLKPDVVTLDIDMPVMDGITAIKHIMIESPVPIVVLSSLTNDGVVTFEALRLGVVDFVPKPSGAISTDIDTARHQLTDRVRVAHTVNLENVRRVRLPKKWSRRDRLENLYGYIPLEYMLAVGTSLSGPNTVIRILSRLSPTLPTAVMVVQEISERIVHSFAREFNEHVPWRVVVAEDGMPVEQGTCYVGSNSHTHTVETDLDGRPCIRVGDGVREPLNRMYASVAETFGENGVGLILTGLGDDGAAGLEAIQRAGGATLAQDALCCVYPNLTAHAINLGVVNRALDENELVPAINEMMT
ncbi:MAG: chemotaxis protein CheB [Desulfatibacillaceae bacterium]